MVSVFGVQRNVFSMCSRFSAHDSTKELGCAFKPPAMLRACAKAA